MITLDRMIKAAEENDWGVVGQNDRYMFFSPFSRMYEPEAIEVYVEDGIVGKGRKDNLIYADIGARRGVTPYNIYAGAALAVIENTHHPLRAHQFFDVVATRVLNHRQLTEPTGTPLNKIRMPAMRGYFNVFDADTLALKLLNKMPHEVWGAGPWFEAISRWDLPERLTRKESLV